ncbi:MAG: hypothetical protein RIQ33_2356, partial [Bacteroidota bacterium]
MKYFYVFALAVLFNTANAQNLILNPSFEDHYISSNPWANRLIFNDSFAPINGYNVIKNWMTLSGSMDAYWTHHTFDIPSNDHSNYNYPHTDSVMVGG